MISKNDIVLLISDLDVAEEEATKLIRKIYASPNLPLDVLKLINEKRQLDLTAFYDKIRKSYN